MHHGAKTHMRGIRTPEWKFMIDFANQGRLELYHLKDDPGETTNLAQSKDPIHLDKILELMSQVKEHMRDINDPLVSTQDFSIPTNNP